MRIFEKLPLYPKMIWPGLDKIGLVVLAKKSKIGLQTDGRTDRQTDRQTTDDRRSENKKRAKKVM